MPDRPFNPEGPSRRERDGALKRAEERTYERARQGGYDDGKARKIAREAVEKGDATKKKLGHW